MNDLQIFMALGNELARPFVQELVEIGGEEFYGTFGDPQMLPLMTRHGESDHLVTELKISRVQFLTPPAAQQTIRRPLTARNYFVQFVDATHPVVYTFLLTDRELPPPL